MDKITHEVRLAHWRRIIEECSNRPGDQTARQWLDDHGITKDQYYYWQRRVRQAEYDKAFLQQMTPPTNVPVTVPDTANISFAEMPYEPSSTGLDSFKASVMIKVGSMTIALSNGVSDDLLARIMREASHA